MNRDLNALKNRLREKVNKLPIHCVVKLDGRVVAQHEFSQDVVKIGRLPSSHLCLDGEGVARMHAVLERSATWRVIDLGSSTGTRLDGEYVNRSTDLPPQGVLEFGAYEVTYRIGDASLADLVDDVAKAEMELDTRDHHKDVMEALMAELEKCAPKSHRSASFMQKGWSLFDDEKKRKYLRMVVEAIREARLDRQKFDERTAAAMLALGPEGIEEIYNAEPAAALAKARETLQEMSQAKASLALLTDMNLTAGIEEATRSATKMGRAELEGLAHFKRGHENLRENLETIIAAGTTVLLACISRGGGATLSDEEREKMRAQWDAAVSAAKSD